MCLFLKITNEKYTHKGYLRKDFCGQNLFKQYAFKEIYIDVTNENRMIQDAWMEQLLEHHIIDEEKYETYWKRINELIGDFETYKNCSDQEIYHDISMVRSEFITSKELKFLYEYLIQQKLDDFMFINQTREEEIAVKKCTDIVFFISDVRFLHHFISDIEKYKERNIYLLLKKQLYFSEEILNKLHGYSYQIITENTCKYYMDFSKITLNKMLNKSIDEEKVLLIAYGEEALLSVKDLRLHSVVYTTAECVASKAMTNNFSVGGISKVFVPKNCNIYPYVKLSEKTKISYYHLAKMANDYGMDIYHSSCKTLYWKYPEYFLNIYDDNMTHRSIFRSVIDKNEDDDFCVFREKFVERFFQEVPQITYKKGYYQSSNLEVINLDWETKEIQDAILVHATVLHKVAKAKVINLKDTDYARRFFRNNSNETVQIISNFLFFTTEKTIALHNRIRKKYPKECIVNKAEHIDYLRIKENGMKRESFPLYNKSCIAINKQGEFKIFRFMLNGGELSLNGDKIRWTKDNINIEGKCRHETEIIVYTPYISKNDITRRYSMSDSLDYQKSVGEDRLNIAFIGERIYCIKNGEMLLPANGVVISLAGEAKKRLEAALTLECSYEGYYDISNLKYEVNLDPPEKISNELWESFEWIYGGAMTLIEDGKALFDKQTIVSHMIEEGWETPLSMQTQETDIQNLSKHPRTAIGVDNNGDLFILVFSGRTNISRGADYLQMIEIANKMIPDIECMINVDGGASSVLAMVKNGEVMELSYPAASNQTCVGVMRNIKTIFNIEL